MYRPGIFEFERVGDMENRNKSNRDKIIQNAILPVFEGLEQRRFLNASIELFGSELVVTGTGGNDSVGVTRSGTNLLAVANGIVQTFAYNTITKISVDSGEGNDTVTLNSALLQNLMQFNGSDGDDTLLIKGTTSADYLSIFGYSVILSSGKRVYTQGFEQIKLDGRGGGDDILVDDGVEVTAFHQQDWASLTLGYESRLNLQSIGVGLFGFPAICT